MARLERAAIKLQPYCKKKCERCCLNTFRWLILPSFQGNDVLSAISQSTLSSEAWSYFETLSGQWYHMKSHDLIKDVRVGAFKEQPKAASLVSVPTDIFYSGAHEGVSMCTRVEQALSFNAFFPSLYLCRAARGSADIPILPHAHTILLKRAVNLKRKRTLFTSKQLFHHPIVLPTSRYHTNIGFSQISGA